MTYIMNSTIKAKWLERLRDPEIKQGRGTLKAEVDGEMLYCCLGVLCEIAVEEGIIKESTFNEESNSYAYQNGVNTEGHPIVEFGVLPSNVARWAGFGGDVNPWISGAGGLAAMNDDGKSFNDIADIIEENILEER